VDAGANSERIECRACGTELDGGWWAIRMERASLSGFTRLAVVTPCCATSTSLNDLAYVRPAGFIRAEVRVRNPGRDRLTAPGRTRVADALGHPVREVRAHL
jgi:hypothetical protein